MGRVGIAELKASLSQYLARVKAGETVVVTDHGRPVARLVPMDEGTLKSGERLRSLERLGLVRLGVRALPAGFWEQVRPIDVAGRSLELLLNEREDSR